MNKLNLFLLFVAVLITGCTSTAPNYQNSIANIEAAGKLSGNVAVGKFAFEKGKEKELNDVGARASTFKSPVNDSYADYLAQAVSSELKAAGKLDPAATKTLTAVIEKNWLSAAGMSMNEAEVRVRFKLQDGTNTSFEKTLISKNEWESSFIGAIAIPRAIQNYVGTLQKLLNQLYSDSDFASATAKK